MIRNRSTEEITNGVTVVERNTKEKHFFVHHLRIKWEMIIEGSIH